MKVRLENREYELKANGRFMLKYQETFNESIMMALYKATVEKDILSTAKLTYCAINEELPFSDWLNSFERPMFILDEMDNIIGFITREVSPSVQNKETSEDDDSKKKN